MVFHSCRFSTSIHPTKLAFVQHQVDKAEVRRVVLRTTSPYKGSNLESTASLDRHGETGNNSTFKNPLKNTLWRATNDMQHEELNRPISGLTFTSVQLGLTEWQPKVIINVYWRQFWQWMLYYLLVLCLMALEVCEIKKYNLTSSN